MKKIISLFLLLSTTLALSGCFGKSSGETRYYLLDYIPTIDEKIKAEEPYPYVVRFKEFSIAEAYRRNNLVYRLSAYELLFYNFELWAVKPERLVSDLVYRHFKEADLFRDISKEAGIQEPHFELIGDISALEEFDNKEKWYAHINLTLSLLKYRTKEVIWSRTYDYRRPVQQQEPVFVVRELSTILEVINDEAISSLDSLFSSPDFNFDWISKEKKTDLSFEDSSTLPPPTLDAVLPVPEVVPQ